MRRMMRVGAAMFALLVAANVAVAQGGGGGGNMGGQRGGGRGGAGQAERLLTGITLSDATKAKVADIAKWYDEEVAKLPAPAGRGDTTGRGKRMDLTTEFQKKLRDLLTPDQQKMFDSTVTANAQRGRGRRGGH